MRINYYGNKESDERSNISVYRVGHLAFGISTTGYFEFERRNNIYDEKFSFLFDIYEMSRLNKIGKY